MKKNNTKKNKTYIFISLTNYLILLALLTFTYFTYNSSYHQSIWAELITIMSLVLLVYQIIIVKLKNFGFLSFQFIFIFLSYIFLFGQIWLIGFGYEEAIFWGVIFRYSDELLFQSSLFSLCYTQALLIGLVSNTKIRVRENSFLFKISELDISSYMYTAGMLLLIVSIPFRLYMDIYSVIFVQMAHGYQGIVAPVGPMKDIAILTIPSIIFIIASKKKSKKVNVSIMLIVISYLIFFMMSTGDRRYYVTAIISIVLTFIKIYDQKLKPGTILLLGSGGLLGLNFLSVLRQTRRYSLQLTEFLDLYITELISMNPLIETLSEFGLSFLTVVAAQKLVPSIIPYQYGFSFYGAIASILPIGWLFGDFFYDVSIARVLNATEGYPMGSSLPAELYANFAWYGIFAAILFGILFSKIFDLHNKNNLPKGLLIARYYATFYILINFIRASTLEMFRQGIIVYFVPTVTIYLLWSWKKPIK